MSFRDFGLTCQTPDGRTFDCYERPPFKRKDGDWFRSALLRRCYFDLGSGTPALVDERGRLVRGALLPRYLRQELKMTEPEVVASLHYIEENHLIWAVPFGYEGLKFWRTHTHGTRKNDRACYCNSNGDFAHLL